MTRLTLLAICVALAGCGGGGGSGNSPPPATASSATGLWTGNGTGSLQGNIGQRKFSGIVLSDGRFYFLYSDQYASDLSSVAGVATGTGSMSGSDFTGSMTDYALASNAIYTGSVSVSVRQANSISGTTTEAVPPHGQNVTTIAATYDSSFASTTPQLATIAGTYTGSARTKSATDPVTLTIAANGNISATSGTCTIGGTVTPRTDGNAYNMTATFTGSCRFGSGTSLSGIGYYDAANKRLVGMAPNGSTDGFLFFGTKP